MLLTIANFRSRVKQDLPRLISDLQDLTGRYGESEAEAWRTSLPVVAKAFSAPPLAPLHLYFDGSGQVALEYRLPAAPAWCDMVLLGRHGGRPSVAVLELKDWDLRGDRPGPREGLVIRHTGVELHPSDQVRGYSEYARRFHSAVLDNDASVHGCVLLTRAGSSGAYLELPNHELARAFPLFGLRSAAGIEDFEGYLAERLTAPDAEFATAFAKGTYCQDRSFVAQIGAKLTNPEGTPFVLLDGQRKAFSIVLAEARTALREQQMSKKVLVVLGPPGSGKSVIAGKLWAELVTDEATPDGNVVFVTTSASQNSNWVQLFRAATELRAAGGAVIKANEFIPVTTQQVGRIKKQFGNVLKEAPQWRDNLRLFRAILGSKMRTPDNHYLVSIVDEAHALINPEHSDGRGQFGFAIHAGPQAFHVMRASTISIFLMDPEQRFRERETTSLDDIRDWATELGADLTVVSLDGCQFRCGGSVEYVDWLEAMLRGGQTGGCRALAKRWHRSQPSHEAAEPSAPSYGLGSGPRWLEFRVLNSLPALEAALREKTAAGATARLVASYARPWKTKGVAHPHELPPQMMDFHEPYLVEGKRRYWSRIWNFIPRGDYSVFIQAPPGSHLHADPLCEIGCPYAVRGFDFDYIGLLWLNDLKWRGDGWVVDLDHVHESGLSRHLSRARKENDPRGPAHRALVDKLLQAYRVLLTRAMHGVYIWFEDTETRAHVLDCLGP